MAGKSSEEDAWSSKMKMSATGKDDVSTTKDLTTSADDDDGDDTQDHETKHAAAWVIPAGAESIVRQIAAEEILYLLLGDIFSMAIVGQTPKKPETKTAEFDTIRNIALEFPGTCLRKYLFKWEDESTRELFPLAALCCLRPPLDVLTVLHEANTQAVKEVEATRESLPLHYAAGFGASLDVVRFLHDKHPSAVSACRTDLVTPLHLACAYYKGGEPDVIQFLLDTCPEGASQRATDMGWSPLHSASHGGAPLDVLERLADLQPESVSNPDSKGRTPLHIACERKGNLPGVEFLLSKAPQLVDVEDDSRFTPISLAAMHQSIDVLKVLLEHNEMLEDNHGVTLLHMAAFQNTVEVIDFLAQRYPYMVTARVRDGDQYTPLLAACRHEASVDVVRALIRHDPNTLNMADGDGRPPIESARQAGAEPAILATLQEELNAAAAAAFWPPPFAGENGYRRDDGLVLAPPRFGSPPVRLLASIPALEAVPSFTSSSAADEPATLVSLGSSFTSSNTARSEQLPAPRREQDGVSQSRVCLPWRWLRMWRR